MLGPGELAKISVCMNPAAVGPAESEIGLGWNARDFHYALWFNTEGKLSNFRKRSLTDELGWRGSREDFDLDLNNRTVTFKG